MTDIYLKYISGSKNEWLNSVLCVRWKYYRDDYIEFLSINDVWKHLNKWYWLISSFNCLFPWVTLEKLACTDAAKLKSLKGRNELKWNMCLLLILFTLFSNRKLFSFLIFSLFFVFEYTISPMQNLNRHCTNKRRIYYII